MHGTCDLRSIPRERPTSPWRNEVDAKGIRGASVVNGSVDR